MEAGLKKSGLEEPDLEKAVLGWGAMEEARDGETGLDEVDLEEGGLKRSDLLEETGLVENALEKSDRGDASLQLKKIVLSSDLGDVGPEEDDMKEPGLEVVEFPRA